MAKLRDALFCPLKAQEAVQHLNTHILWHLILLCETEVSGEDIWLIFSCINRKCNDRCRTSELGSTHSSVVMCHDDPIWFLQLFIVKVSFYIEGNRETSRQGDSCLCLKKKKVKILNCDLCHFQAKIFFFKFVFFGREEISDKW